MNSENDSLPPETTVKKNQQERCPLCNSPAVYYGVDADNLKYFDCPSCTKFLISWRACERVLISSFEKRQTWARMAKLAPEGQVLLIVIPPPSQDPDIPREPVAASWVAKSEFRL